MSENLYFYCVKLFSLLLAFFVLALTVTPCCVPDVPEGDLHETVVMKSKGCNELGGDCCSTCSPFYVCCSGAGLATTAQQSADVFRLPLAVNHRTAYVTPNLPLVPMSIWQPPQLG
ncbi:hypothetical protein C7T94_08695 [Pedobacter yulinensis]|uniref:Uncharacterized protein n=1 Tax=Pedobacter yulinensis TaxID=2126353 RepID=A0A2T3HJZ1_9SPHI|nr:hypothetical protein [Pedobacter yulinensis]PST82723.1 hypothetical protein C7T94_08695 [Pedobacter yulinensis]